MDHVLKTNRSPDNAEREHLSLITLACSRESGLISYRIPDEWKDRKKIEVFQVDEDGNPTKSEFRLKDRKLEFNAEANSPYKVIYNE
ncbi:hypothetical protein ACFLU5_00230 [Bacteroidota bacterium]